MAESIKSSLSKANKYSRGGFFYFYFTTTLKAVAVYSNKRVTTVQIKNIFS